MTFLQGSAVPGMAVPGASVPAKDGTSGGGGGATAYLYLGHVPVTYLDYLDTATSRTLNVAPGGSYSMTPVNSRAGLTVPPPDHSWNPPDTFSFRIVLHHAAAFAAARAHSAALQAATLQAAAAIPPVLHGQGTPSPPAPPPAAPSEAALTLARARARNAHLQALAARGETAGC